MTVETVPEGNPGHWTQQMQRWLDAEKAAAPRRSFQPDPQLEPQSTEQEMAPQNPRWPRVFPGL